MANGKPYNEAQRQLVTARAIEAQAARIAHNSQVVLGWGDAQQRFYLDIGGYCCRFVRQAFETALNISPFSWPFATESAHDTLAKLAKYAVPLDQRQAGDILGFAGNPGHICIYLGRAADPAKELVAENTSSANRGWPSAAGTKLTAYATVLRAHNGEATCYRLFG